ncbi:hypothetical protein B0H19DRAFT_419187 [Mycena capillaripes]|nr:hypothetical protein B0H19DRAFT_419187 [Mycena capillaripes]
MDSLVIAPIPQQDLRDRAETDSKCRWMAVSLTHQKFAFWRAWLGVKRRKCFQHWMWSTTQQQTKGSMNTNDFESVTRSYELEKR